MENLNFEKLIPEKKVDSIEKGSKIELTGPNLRIFNSTKKELSMLFGFGFRDIDTDVELTSEINRHFLENNGMINNKIAEWKISLSDVNKDAAQTESLLAKNFAKQIYEFITKKSKIKDRFNN